MRSRRSELVWFAPAAVLLLAVIAYPVLRTIALSFEHRNPAAAFEARFVGFDNFARIIVDSRFAGSVRTTLLFTLVSVSAEFGLGLLLALSVQSMKRWSSAVRVILLTPWTLPTAVIATLWTWIFNDQFGALNAILSRSGFIHSPIAWLAQPTTAMAAMIIADVWKTTPFVFIILLAGIQDIPNELYEAIEIDGGSAWAKFRYVTWPHLLNFVFVAVVFRMVQAFAVFDLVWVMTGGGPGGATETVSVYTYQTYMRYLDLGYGAALSVTIFVFLSLAGAGLYRLFMTKYERSL